MLWCFLHRHCREYEAGIEAAGRIDLQLLGLGRMGHIGFNEQGYAHLRFSGMACCYFPMLRTRRHRQPE